MSTIGYGILHFGAIVAYKDTPKDIRKAVEAGFKELVHQKSYRSISVADISKFAHISRYSFYEYYSNKEDVVSSIFMQDAMKPLEEAHSLFSSKERRNIDQISDLLLTKMYLGIFDNGDYYIHLVKPMKGKDDTFIRVVTNAIYDFDIKLLENTGYAGNEKEADYSAYIFASSQAMVMQKWIASEFDVAPSDLAALYNTIMTPFWLENTF